jgi:FMN reductase
MSRRVVVLVGNPKAASRTAAAGLQVAEAIARLAPPDETAALETVELAPLAGELFQWGAPSVATAKDTVLGADLLVVASPVYKAAVPGLLKAFLDQFDRDELAGAATVPVMVGAAPIHHLAVELHLKPVLVEIGASCPTRGLFLLESQLEDLTPALDAFFHVWAGPLRRALGAAS